MRLGVLALGVALAASWVAVAHANVATQQWSTLGLNPKAQALGGVPAPGANPQNPAPYDASGGAYGALRTDDDPPPEGFPPPPPGGRQDRLDRDITTGPVPEPGTISLLAMGLLGAGLGMRRRKSS